VSRLPSAAEHAASARPALLFYCQHSLGMGHLVRSFALARALAGTYDVVFVNGGRFPPGIAAPAGIEIVQLDPLGMDEQGRLVSLDPTLTVDQSFVRRAAALLALLTEREPRAIVVELFPFGRKKHARELVPLLESARRMTPAPLVLCSLRDILVKNREDQQAFDDRAARTLEEHFDAVLVHSDPQFARLDESFRPTSPLRVPVHYTGFVTANERADRTRSRERRVLVSAGGGIVGGALLRAAVAAQRELWPALRLPMTIVAGPFLPEAEWNELASTARGVDGLRLLRAVPDLGAEMRDVTLSVSQCGYNTAMDILCSGVKALVVPFTRPQENEQLERARRLALRGLVRLLPEDALNADTLARELHALVDFEPNPTAFHLDGAVRTTDLITRLLASAALPCLPTELAR
jgi:predicted glycosyltransferase